MLYHPVVNRGNGKSFIQIHVAGKINCRSEIFHYERVTRAEMLATIDKWLPVFAIDLERMMIIA